MRWLTELTSIKKKRATELLMIEVMSVEESCYEDDEDGNSLRVAKYFVGRLQLESKQMKKLSKDLIWFTLKKKADYQSLR